MAYTSVAALFTAICNSIRAKLGTTDPIAHQDIPSSIDAIVTDEGGADVSGVTATVGDVLAPKVFVDSSGVEKEGTITSKGAATYTPSESAQEIAAGQYLSGKQTISAIPSKYKDMTGTDAAAADLLNGKKAGNTTGQITGTMPNRGAVSGTISTKSGTYTIQSGYHDGSGSVAIASAEQAKIIAGNIKSGVTILGQAGTYTGSSWQNASGTVNPNSSGDVTISGLSFSPKICAIYFDDGIEGYFFLYEYVGGHWLMSGVFGWRENVDNEVSTTSSSITIYEITAGEQTVNYSVWG